MLCGCFATLKGNSQHKAFHSRPAVQFLLNPSCNAVNDNNGSDG